MREIIIIAAMSENRVIGRDNAMPWSIKGNLAHFKEMTMGWPCIMGRKTWESLPKKPLPGRLNIIISNTMTVTDSSVPKNELCPQERALSPKMSSVPKDELCSQESSSVPKDNAQNVKIFPSLPSAIEYCADYEKIFICGGESIYRQALPLADKIELTLIYGQYDGDTFFPEIDAACWTPSKTVDFDNFSIITYTRTNKNEKEQT
jgi:dihydrofolate reductase